MLPARQVIVRTGDSAIDRMFQGLRDEIDALRKMALIDAVVIDEVSLADGIETAVPHKRGKRWKRWWAGSLRGATSTGRIVAVRAGDDDKFLRLTATGHGATITVSVVVQ